MLTQNLMSVNDLTVFLKQYVAFGLKRYIAT